jgi:hypothetical protein
MLDLLAANGHKGLFLELLRTVCGPLEGSLKAHRSHAGDRNSSTGMSSASGRILVNYVFRRSTA